VTHPGRRFVLGALVATAGLGACSREAATPVATRGSLADSADQVMFKLRTVLTDEGVMKARLEGDSGFFFDENTRVELRGVRTLFFSSTGAQDAVLTSREGTYNTRGGVMEARKNVVVVTTDGKRLTSPMLRFEQYRNLVLSDSAFVLTRGGERIEGVGFESDPRMLNIKVRRFVRSSGGSVTLPAARTTGGGGAGMILRADTTVRPVAPAVPSPAPTTPPPAGSVSP
jgi:LPS export ABC transporter protein LptC